MVCRTRDAAIRRGHLAFCTRYRPRRRTTCYRNPEPTFSILSVEDDLAAAEVGRAQFAGAADPETIVRDRAVVVAGQREAAYAFSVVADGELDLVYCIGRGVLMDGGTRCRMNPCGDATMHFVTGAGATSDGDVCFHTCFRGQ